MLISPLVYAYIYILCKALPLDCWGTSWFNSFLFQFVNKTMQFSCENSKTVPLTGGKYWQIILWKSTLSDLIKWQKITTIPNEGTEERLCVMWFVGSRNQISPLECALKTVVVEITKPLQNSSHCQMCFPAVWKIAGKGNQNFFYPKANCNSF